MQIWLVAGSSVNLFHFRHFFPVFRGHDTVAESFPDIIHCLLRRVQHVFSIEPVVPEFVHHYFVCGKIIAVSVIPAYLIHSQQERAFAQLVFMRPVPEMPYGADREYHFLFRTHTRMFQIRQDFPEISGGFSDSESESFEFPGIPLEAV